MTDHKKQTSQVSRREFIKKGASAVAAGTAGLGVLAAGAPGILHAENKGERIRFGVVGSGSRACEVMREMAPQSESFITDLCDIYPPHLSEALNYAENPKVRTHQDWRALIDRKDIDAIYIGTPLHLHVPISVAAMEAGKHVYSEKSMGLNMAQCNQMLATVKKHPELTYLVGYQSRAAEGHEIARDIVNSGSLGRITQFYCHYDRNQTWRRDDLTPEWDRQLNWRLYHEYCGGLLTEVISHKIDQVLDILQIMPISAAFNGQIMVYQDGRENHDSIMGSWQMENGVIGVGTGHLTSANHGACWILIGTHGTMEVYSGMIKLYWEKKARHLHSVGIKHKVTNIKLGQSHAGAAFHFEYLAL